MTEKTLRYPGHIGIISALKESGFFNKEKILVGDHIISPLDVSSKILINEWKLGDEEEEFTVMKVIVEGVVSETPMTLEFSLYDEYNKETQTSSMARTTGYTYTAMVELILSNSLNEEPGVFPPEFIGKSEEGYDFVLKYLRERGVNWICSSKISIY
jgi:saccharopine dehydrogenase-like NADP-dependent oxidoreductase